MVSAPKACRRHGVEFDQAQYRGYGYGFIDAWKYIHGDQPGYTFSNMPKPGLISRPDRILVSKSGLKVKSIMVNGKGHLYSLNFAYYLWHERRLSVMQAMRTGDSRCEWDCGPHGSCRCGICVSGGNEYTCKHSTCSECSTKKLYMYYFFVTSSIVYTCYSVIYIILTVIHFLRRRYFHIYRKIKRIRCLTNHYIFLSCLTLCLLNILFVKFAFWDVLRIIEMQLDEELNPSDHLMVIARIEIL